MRPIDSQSLFAALRFRPAMSPDVAAPLTTDPAETPGGDTEPASAEQTQLRLRAKVVHSTTDATLRVETDEGDVITLTLHEDRQVTYGRLRAQVSGLESKQDHGLRFREFSLSRDVSVSVEGDLNDQELADLHALMEQLRPAMSGRPDHDANDQASQLLEGGDFESLARFDLSVERHREVFRIDLKARVRGAWQLTPRDGVTATPTDVLDETPQPLPVDATS